MAPTVHQIAEAAGVSIATVSQVLNNRGQRFRPETRERVWRIALARGYRPNPAARALRQGRLGAVGLVIGEPSGSHLPDALLRGLADGLSRSGAQLVVATMNEGGGETLVGLERRLGVDGLLINRHQGFGGDLVAQRQAATLPVVWINADLSTGCVRPDDEAAGRLSTERMIALGHRRIAWLDVLRHGEVPHHSVIAREAGYRQAMSAAGLRCRRLAAPAHVDLGAVHRWLRTQVRRSGVSAAVAYSFHSVIALRQVCAALGQPEPSMVVIADEDPVERGVIVDHVLVPWRAIAAAILDEMSAQLDGSPPCQAQVIPPLCSWT